MTSGTLPFLFRLRRELAETRLSQACGFDSGSPRDNIVLRMRACSHSWRASVARRCQTSPAAWPCPSRGWPRFSILFGFARRYPALSRCVALRGEKGGGMSFRSDNWRMEKCQRRLSRSCARFPWPAATCRMTVSAQSQGPWRGLSWPTFWMKASRPGPRPAPLPGRFVTTWVFATDEVTGRGPSVPCGMHPPFAAFQAAGGGFSYSGRDRDRPNYERGRNVR